MYFSYVSCVSFSVAPLSDDKRLLTSFENAIEKGGHCTQTVMQAILHGYAGIGKTSLIKSLLGQKSSKDEKSTDVMEEPKRIELSTVAVEGSDSTLNWTHVKNLDEESALLVNNVNSDQIKSCLHPRALRLRIEDAEEYEEDIMDDETLPPAQILQYRKYTTGRERYIIYIYTHRSTFYIINNSCDL